MYKFFFLAKLLIKNIEFLSSSLLYIHIVVCFFFCIYPRELELHSSVVGHCVAPLGLSTVAYLAVGQASEVKKSICLLNPPTFFPTCQGIVFGSDPLEPCLLLKLFSVCAELLFVQSPTCMYIYRPIPRRLHYHSHVPPL